MIFIISSRETPNHNLEAECKHVSPTFVLVGCAPMRPIGNDHKKSRAFIPNQIWRATFKFGARLIKIATIDYSREKRNRRVKTRDYRDFTV